MYNKDWVFTLGHFPWCDFKCHSSGLFVLLCHTQAHSTHIHWYSSTTRSVLTYWPTLRFSFFQALYLGKFFSLQVFQSSGSLVEAVTLPPSLFIPKELSSFLENIFFLLALFLPWSVQTCLLVAVQRVFPCCCPRLVLFLWRLGAGVLLDPAECWPRGHWLPQSFVGHFLLNVFNVMILWLIPR